MGWRLTVALVVSWQNKVGDRQRGDGRRKQTMNNLRVMPHDLSTSFVLPLIWIPEKVVVLTGSLSSHGRGPLTVTAFSRGQMRACVGVSTWQCGLVCGCAISHGWEESCRGTRAGGPLPSEHRLIWSWLDSLLGMCFTPVIWTRCPDLSAGAVFLAIFTDPLCSALKTTCWWVTVIICVELSAFLCLRWACKRPFNRIMSAYAETRNK